MIKNFIYSKGVGIHNVSSKKGVTNWHKFIVLPVSRQRLQRQNMVTNKNRQLSVDGVTKLTIFKEYFKL